MRPGAPRARARLPRRFVLELKRGADVADRLERERWQCHYAGRAGFLSASMSVSVLGATWSLNWAKRR